MSFAATPFTTSFGCAWITSFNGRDSAALVARISANTGDSSNTQADKQANDHQQCTQQKRHAPALAHHLIGCQECIQDGE